jgi:CRP-like cAMP-binding protein
MNSLCLAPAQLRDTMSRLAYFRDWSPAVVARLAANTMQFVVAKDCRMITQGDPAEHLYVVVSGQIRLFLPLSTGTERIVTLMAQGEGFGEACILTDSAFPYSVAACRDSHILAVHRQAYLREMNGSAEMKGSSLQLLARRLLFTLRDMEICAQPSSLQRVVRFLISQQADETIDQFEIRLPGRKRDIAAKLALSQETLSRMLTHLGQQGLIEVAGGVVKVASLARLRQIDAAICGKDALPA